MIGQQGRIGEAANDRDLIAGDDEGQKLPGGREILDEQLGGPQTALQGLQLGGTGEKAGRAAGAGEPALEVLEGSLTLAHGALPFVDGGGAPGDELLIGQTAGLINRPASDHGANAPRPVKSCRL